MAAQRANVTTLRRAAAECVDTLLAASAGVTYLETALGKLAHLREQVEDIEVQVNAALVRELTGSTANVETT